MAQVTDRLPLTNTTNRIIEDPAPVPVLGEIASFIGDTVEGFSSLMKERAADRAARKKAEDEARRRAVVSETFTAIQNAEQMTLETPQPAAPVGVPVERLNLNPETGRVFEGKDPVVNPDIERDVAKSAIKLTNVDTAVNQGRMPGVSMSAALTSEFNRLRAKFPGEEEVILDLMKKAGVDTNLFQIGRDAADRHEFEREQGQEQLDWSRDVRNGYIKTALDHGGEGIEKMSEPQLVAHGMAITQAQNELAQGKILLDMAKTRGDIEESKRVRQERDGNLTVKRALTTAMFANSAPIAGQLQDLLGVLSTPDVTEPEQQKRFQLFSGRVNGMIEQSINNSVMAAQAAGYTGDLTELRSEWTAMWKGVRDSFVGEFSNAKTNMAALTAVRTTLDLELHETLPFYMALKQAGIDPETIPGVLESLSPDLISGLHEEVKGFNLDYRADRASERMINIVKLMRGEATLRDWSYDRAKREMPSLFKINKTLVTDYSNGKINEVDSVLNSLGNLTFAANSVKTSGSSTDNFYASVSLSGNSIAALKRASSDPNADKEMVAATAQALRATHAHILNNVRANIPKLNEANPYFKIEWDDRNGNYKIKPTGKSPGKGTVAGGAVGVAVRGSVLQAAKIPPEMERWVRIANMSLKSAIDVGKLDPTTPKGTDLELRRWYGNEQPLRGQAPTGKPINVGREAEKALQAFGKSLADSERAVKEIAPKVLEANTSANADESGGASSERTNYKANPRYTNFAPVVSGAAQKYGIPEEVLGSLLQFESEFDPNAEGPVIKSGTHAGDRAMGIGQVMAKTAAAFGVTDRASLTPEQQIDLAARVLADNKEAGGSWKDAVSRYFTGVDYATAKKQGRTDGYTDVFNYVESIVGD